MSAVHPMSRRQTADELSLSNSSALVTSRLGRFFGLAGGSLPAVLTGVLSTDSGSA